MVDEGGGLHWAASHTTWGGVRGVRVPPPQADDDDRRVIYPRAEVRGSLALAPVPEEAQYDCPIRFQGQWEDPGSGLYYNLHRHYDSLCSQYVSADSIRLRGGANQYAFVSNPTKYVDPIGLQAQPRFNVDGEAGGTSRYAQWQNPDGSFKWPPNDGAVPGSTKTTTLAPGTVIDRYGYGGGKYTSPVSVPYEQRSLMPGTHLKPYKRFMVQKPIDVTEGTVAPWFGEPGGGTQYLMPNSVGDLVKGGSLTELK